MVANDTDILEAPLTDETAKAVIQFDPTQRRFFDDKSSVVIGNWHRQKGKDFAAAAKSIADAFETKRNWYIISMTQRQADATFDKCKKVVEAIKRVMKIKGKVGLSYEDFEDYDSEIDHLFPSKAHKIELPGGGSVTALPGRDPDSLAGLTGCIVLTEFGLFKKGGYPHWRVLKPLTTRGFQCVVISTPRGKKTRYYEICSDPETYSYHFCDIYKSIAEDGFILKDNNGEPCSLEAFKKEYGDDAGFDREYGCIFGGDLEALIPYALLLSAQDPTLDIRVCQVTNGQGWDPSIFHWPELPAGRWEFGWDVARKRDLSVLAGWLAGRDGKKELRFLVIMRNTKYELQRQIICAAMDGRVGSVGCGDATGAGEDSNETLTSKYGERWEGVKFTLPNKSQMGSTGRTLFGDGCIRIPAFTQGQAKNGLSLKAIAADINSIQCQQVEDPHDKRLLLEETDNELLDDSHCDIAYASLLGLRAGSLTGGRFAPVHTPLRNKPRGF